MTDGANTRGWFIGPFLDDAAGIRAAPYLELKWVNAPAGARRAQIVTHETRTTVLILIAGKCRVRLNSSAIILADPGDYLIWGPDIDHTWEILEDSTLLTVRRQPSAAQA